MSGLNFILLFINQPDISIRCLNSIAIPFGKMYCSSFFDPMPKSASPYFSLNWYNDPFTYQVINGLPLPISNILLKTMKKKLWNWWIYMKTCGPNSADFIPNELIKTLRVCLMQFYTKHIQFYVGVTAAFSSVGDWVQEAFDYECHNLPVDISLSSIHHR